jgi:hypothetical protein
VIWFDPQDDDDDDDDGTVQWFVYRLLQ